MHDDETPVVASEITEFNDTGNAKFFAAMHRGDIRWFPARRSWLVWRENRWVIDPDGEIIRRGIFTLEEMRNIAIAMPNSPTDDGKVSEEMRARSAALRWINTSLNEPHLSTMIKVAQSAPGMSVESSTLDADPWLLNCRNGVLDLRTGTLQPPTKQLLQTKMAATEFHADAKSDLWLKFVQTLTGGDVELAAFLQRSLGYALYGAWAEKAFWFAYGPPDGGKSTLLAIVGRILGDYHVSADASTWMVGHQAGNRGDLVRLMGARLVTTSEIRAGARFDEEVVKKVTGGDMLTYAAKYEADVSFLPTFALWLAANDRPVISSGDDGMWRRVRCVPCTHVVPRTEQNPRLVSILSGPDHAPGVLSWLVDGCRMWAKDGIGSAKAIELEAEAYKRDMNPLAEFVEDQFQLTDNEDDWVPVSAVKDAYTEWCQRRREKFPLKAKSFNRAFKSLGVAGGDNTSRKERVGKRDVTVWRKIRRVWDGQ